MADTLYRRYRPTTFADLVDQRHVRITLEHALTQDRIAHAYMFTGPRGVGKTTLARLFARAVNCQQRGPDSAEPCNTCPTCVAQLTNASLDVIEIDAASQTGVDNVRENIIQSARAIPALGKYKIFIVDEVHMLSTSAFNALLKLLEEPPAHAIFILATTEIHRVPETVISRTQRFDFKKIRLDDIVTRLEKLAVAERRQLAPGVAERIARAADGSLRDAESSLTQLFSFPEKTVTLELADLVLPRSDRATLLAIVEAIIRGQTVPALTHLHHFIDDGGDIPVLLHELVAMSRALMLAALDVALLAEAMTSEDSQTLMTVAELAQLREPSFFVTMAESFLEAERLTLHAPIHEFPLEIAIMTLGDVHTSNGLRVSPVTPTLSPSTEEVGGAVVPARPVMPRKTPGKKKLTSESGNPETKTHLATVQAAWRSVQQQAAVDHPGLALSIKLSTVQAVDGQRVVIAAPFKLHVERLNAPTQRAHVAELLRAVLGQPVQLEVIQTADIPTLDPSPNVSGPSAAVTPAVGLESSGPKNELWDQVVATFS